MQFKVAMAKRNMSLVAAGTFRRNTTAVKSALLEIMKANPEAVVTVGPYKPVAEFIKLARQVKMDAVFVAISFVGSDALALEIGEKGAGDCQPGGSIPARQIVAGRSVLSGGARRTRGAKPGFVSWKDISSAVSSSRR